MHQDAHTADPTEERRHLVITIDDNEYRVPMPEVTGRQILEVAGRHPTTDFIVYWLDKEKVLRDLGLEQVVHLHHDSVECFLTFESDRSFRFEIDGKREDWGAPTITEGTLRMLAGVGHDFRVWLERQEQPDQLIERHAAVDLTAPATERFRTERVFSVTVVNEDDGREVELEEPRHVTLASIFEDAYQRLGVRRQADDRLRCEAGGEDVLSFGQLTLGQYVQAGHCTGLVWLLAGGTGGARCQ